jgi:hypothetical protein
MFSRLSQNVVAFCLNSWLVLIASVFSPCSFSERVPMNIVMMKILAGRFVGQQQSACLQ